MKRMFSLLQGNRDLPGFLQARRPAGPRIDSSAKNVFDGRVRADSGRIESPRLPAAPRPACYRGFFLHRHHAASDDADAYSNLSEFAAVHETVHSTTATSYCADWEFRLRRLTGLGAETPGRPDLTLTC